MRSYTHKYVVDDYDGEPFVESQEREIFIKVTAWFCADSFTYRLDTMAIIRANEEEYAWVWGGENPFRPLSITMPTVHLAAVPPYTTEADIKRDALSRVRIYADTARRACKESKLDMSRISDQGLIAQYERDSVPF
ncbi:MAG: hypothetical protein EI684_06025 [Candidatus Viridilinea halotolerans]|uniref:Uncharacterized protein n=1 Tax=Candidatus Viridilinea halotolerans TaxID=2491704 RepID=A0A426U4R1_9CHLR|nr:MAG: hypothetical protein EI684_06025 [Candidatus Viridilinea halotolerans]